MLGARGGGIFVAYNVGTTTRPEFAPCGEQLFVGLGELRVPGGSAMPIVADWDGDGKMDLVSGSDNGPVYWFRNVGEAGEMEFAAAEKLTDTKGTRTQVAVVDHNGDGLPDLIVGDCVMQHQEAPDLSPEDQARCETLEAEYDELSDKFSALFEEHSGEGEVDFDELLDSNPELEALNERMQELQMELQPLQPSWEIHGWVWLYERIPAS